MKDSKTNVDEGDSLQQDLNAIKLYNERRQLRLEVKELSSKENLSLFRLDFEDKSKKGDIKTVTKYCNRIAKFTKSDYDSLVEGLDCINLERFQEETINALLSCLNDEKRFPYKDYIYLGQYCFELKRRYNTFMKSFESHLSKCITTIDNSEGQRRSAFILYTELFLLFQFRSNDCLKFILDYIKSLCSTKSVFSDEYRFKTISLFIKLNIYEYCGILPDSYNRSISEQHQDIIPLGLISADIQSKFSSLVNMYYKSLCESSQIIHETVLSLTKKINNLKVIKGSATPEMQQELDKNKNSFCVLYEQIKVLSSLLNVNIPKYKMVETQSEEIKKVLKIYTPNDNSEDYKGPFPSLKDHLFYQNIFDISPFLFQNNKSIESTTTTQTNTLEIDSIKNPEDSLTIENTNENLDSNTSQSTAIEPQYIIVTQSLSDAVSAKYKIPEKDEDFEATQTEDMSNIQNQNSLLDPLKPLYDEILEAMTSQEVDTWTTKFVLVNTNQNRFNMANFFYLEGCRSQERQKYFVRAMKILFNVASDIATDVYIRIKRYLNARLYHITTQDTSFTCSLVNYVCDFALFDMIPPSEVFGFMNIISDKLDDNRAQLISLFIERVGPYYLTIPTICDIINKIIDKVKNFMNNMIISPLAKQCLQQSLYICFPETKPVSEKIVIPPRYRYLNYLLYTKLPHIQKDYEYHEIAEELSSYDYDNIDEVNYIMTEILRFPQKCFSHISALAEVLKEVCHNHRCVKMYLVDALTECIQSTLDNYYSVTKQTYYGLIELITELYMFELMKNKQIFRILFLFIQVGHNVTNDIKKKYSFLPQRYMVNHPLVPNETDSPFDCSRLLYALKLLEGCYKFLSVGKLMLYMNYLQRYALSKSIIRIDIQNEYNAILHAVKCKHIFKSYQEADDYIANIELQEYQKNGKIIDYTLESDDDYEGDNDNDNDNDEDNEENKQTTNLSDMDTNDEENNENNNDDDIDNNTSDDDFDTQLDKEYQNLLAASQVTVQNKKIDFSRMAVPFSLLDRNQNEKMSLIVRDKKKLITKSLNFTASDINLDLNSIRNQKTEEQKALNKKTIAHNNLFYENDEDNTETNEDKKNMKFSVLNSSQPSTLHRHYRQH